MVYEGIRKTLVQSWNHEILRREKTGMFVYSFPLTAKKVKNQLLPSGGEFSGPRCSEEFHLLGAVQNCRPHHHGGMAATDVLHGFSGAQTAMPQTWTPVTCGVVARG